VNVRSRNEFAVGSCWVHLMGRGLQPRAFTQSHLDRK